MASKLEKKHESCLNGVGFRHNISPIWVGRIGTSNAFIIRGGKGIERHDDCKRLQNKRVDFHQEFLYNLS